MALKINYNFKIQYNLALGGFNSKEVFTNILTTEQLQQLQDSIDKDFLIENVYCKIDSINGNKNTVEIRINIYKDKTKQVFISSAIYNFEPNLESADNFIKQGYDYLKTLNEYKDAVDLLD